MSRRREAACQLTAIAATVLAPAAAFACGPAHYGPALADPFFWLVTLIGAVVVGGLMSTPTVLYLLVRRAPRVRRRFWRTRLVGPSILASMATFGLMAVVFATFDLALDSAMMTATDQLLSSMPQWAGVGFFLLHFLAAPWAVAYAVGEGRARKMAATG